MAHVGLCLTVCCLWLKVEVVPLRASHVQGKRGMNAENQFAGLWLAEN